MSTWPRPSRWTRWRGNSATRSSTPTAIPSPRADGEMPQVDEGTPLTSWPEHRVGRIVHVEDEPPALFSQLAVFGLTPGAQVEVDERMPVQVLVWSGRQRLTLAPAAAERVFVVDAPPQRMPLSEMEIGQAGRVVGCGQGVGLAERLSQTGLRIGHGSVRGRRGPARRAGALPGERERRLQPCRGSRPTRSCWTRARFARSSCRGRRGCRRNGRASGSCSGATAA